MFIRTNTNDVFETNAVIFGIIEGKDGDAIDVIEFTDTHNISATIQCALIISITLVHPLA